MRQRAWLEDYRQSKGHVLSAQSSRGNAQPVDTDEDLLLADIAFNSHEKNDGSHVSPYDEAKLQVGLDGLQVKLLQGIDEASLRRVLSRATRATTGLPIPWSWPNGPKGEADDSEEMFRGGLQSSLESQVIIFEVWGASRALTHQLVRSRKAAFHQQSQRATWYGDHPDVRMPESIWRAPVAVRRLWVEAVETSRAAYRAACDSGVSYQDARYILTEGTTNYIMCEYPLREFLNVYAYRACSMFLWEMVGCMREMGRVLVEAHPMLEEYVKITCEKGPGCSDCKGSGKVWSDTGLAWDPSDGVSDVGQAYPLPCHTCVGTGGRKCFFQGWENVEGQCDKPMARQENRVFLPSPKYRIGAS